MRNKYALLIILFLCIVPNFLLAQKDSVKTKRILIFPVIGKSIETGLSFGVASSATFKLSKSDTTSRTSNLQAIGIYTLKKQMIIALIGTQYFKKEKFILQEQIDFSYFPDKFWGLGNNTNDAAIEPYDFKQYYIYLHLLRRLKNNFFIGSIVEFQHLLEINYEAGGAFDKENIAGRNRYISSGLGVSAIYDNRNDAFAPNKGGYFLTSFTQYNAVFGSDFNYANIIIDARKYYRLYKQNVLALQAYSLTNVGSEIPIRSIASLGGANSMRGYYNGRYRDKQLFVLQSEFRFSLYKRFAAVAFASLGDVAHSIADISISNLKYSFGGGLRFALNKTEKLNLRIDYGIGKGANSGLYIQLGEAF